MTTTTSYSDSGRFKVLYQSALRRSMGYFGLITVLLLIFYPFQYALRIFRELNEYQQRLLSSGVNLIDVFELLGMGKQFTAVSAIFYTAIICIAPIVLSLVLNSYMHSKKAADVYHAIPVKRETLLGIHTAVAMTIITIPVLACNLLVILFQTMKFGFHPFLVGQILLDMAGWLVCALFIYLMTTTVCTLVGTVFDAFIFSGILMAATPIILLLFTALATEFLFGFQPSDVFLQTLFYLCPFSLMPSRLAFSVTENGFTALSAENSELLFRSNAAIVIYLLLSVGLLIAAMRLYRRRDSETAETTTSKGALQIIIKFLGTLIGGITIGLMFYAVNNAENSSSANMMFIMWSLIGGILTYIIIEVILNRGFKSLIKSLPLGVLMVAIMSVSTLSILLGGFGYENYVPEAGNVESLEISYMGRFKDYTNIFKTELNKNLQESYQISIRSVSLSDPENVFAVVAYHQDIVNDKEPAANQQDIENLIYVDSQITYHLKNGKTVRRIYNHQVKKETLLKLAPLETSAEFLTQTHPAFFTDSHDIIKWTMTDPFGGNKVEQLYSAEESAALLDAMKADLLDQTSEDLLHPTEKLLAVVMFQSKASNENSLRNSDGGYFYVTSEEQRTWQILKEKGIADQLKPDLSKCSAVVASYPGRVFNNAIYQNSPGYIFRYSDLESMKQDLKEQRENMQNKEYDYRYDGRMPSAKEYFGENIHIYEDQALIEQMAQQVVATGAINEPMVTLRFFFSDLEEGTTVVAPLSKLPKNVQLELTTSAIK